MDRLRTERHPGVWHMIAGGWKATALKANRVATKVRTYFEMRTDGQRFLCLKSRISILRRYL